MGQTQSQGKQADLSQIYASYIQKQQDLIYQQQNQINSLYRHNLQNQSQMPPNMYFQHGIQQQQQQQQQPPTEGGTDELDGYFNGSGLGGSGLGYATLDDNNSISESYFASINATENPVDVENDGYVKKSKKTEQFDSDYERMMAERGEIGPGGNQMMGQGL